MSATRKRHVVVGGGTAGVNAITTIRRLTGADEIVLIAAERPYSRMVLPYYLGGQVAEPHLFTATPPRLAELGVRSLIGRRAVGLDAGASRLALDDATSLEYDDLLIATGSSAVRPPIPGADGERIFNLWTLDQCRGVIGAIRPGMAVAVVGAGFIAFTILNALVSRGVRLIVLEIAPRVLPRMIDGTGAPLVEAWLARHGIGVQTGVRITAIEDAGDRKRLLIEGRQAVEADLVVMATGIRPNLDWLAGSGIALNHGIIVDDHQRSNVPNVYAAGDVAEGRDRVTGEPAVHAIEPTAMDHGRVAGANMAGRDVAYAGSLLMNVVDVLDLEIASFGNWDAERAETMVAVRRDGRAYRKLAWDGDRLIGAILIGPARDVWATNDVGMLKGLVQTGISLGVGKGPLAENPWDIRRAYVAAGTAGRLLPVTVLG
ncbi:MAG: NAD(P)/FAD-dependent oxidoreductase [Chloroflexi bacterium]|nr:NAD(P)/FAD-dependent oxidoreductase [Chloroflexota bacterium]